MFAIGNTDVGELSKNGWPQNPMPRPRPTQERSKRCAYFYSGYSPKVLVNAARALSLPVRGDGAARRELMDTRILETLQEKLGGQYRLVALFSKRWRELQR